MYPDPSQVAHQAQSMARNTRDERVALAFQSIAMVSMAIVSVASAGHLLRELLRDAKHRDGGRGR